jgi:HAE1 family hydrophobic/amphiphilic exporter-1
VTQDNSVFISRAITNVQEHALVGGILVVLIIFAFLRDLRSTLIVCTSIPRLGHRHVRSCSISAASR